MSHLLLVVSLSLAAQAPAAKSAPASEAKPKFSPGKQATGRAIAATADGKVTLSTS